MTKPGVNRLVLAVVFLCSWLFSCVVNTAKLQRHSQHARALQHATRRRPRAYLHIGPHKTGSTYIQGMLCTKTQELAQANLVVPMDESCRPRCPSHFVGLAGHLMLGERDAPVDQARWLMGLHGCSSDPIQELKRDLHKTNGSDVIVSAEDFVRLGDGGVAALAALLAEYETYVVIVYRHKLAHLKSLYFQLQRDPQVLLKNPQHVLSFDEFYWEDISGVDPASSTPLHTHINGLFLTKLVHLYGKHFGKEKLIIVNYDNAGDDLWNVFATEVLQTPAANVTVRPQRVNASPDPFLFAVAVRYYRARWGAQGPTKLPDTKCTLPLLAGAAASLPQRCTSLENIVRPWEREENRVLKELRASGSRLIKFDGDLGIRRVSNASVCDVDFKMATRIAGKVDHDEALLWLLRDASIKIDAACF